MASNLVKYSTPEGYEYYAPDQEGALKDFATSLPVEQALLPSHQDYVPTTGQKVIEQLTGANGTERFQFWPEKMIRGALDAPNAALTGRVAPGSEEELGGALDAAGIGIPGLAKATVRGMVAEQPNLINRMKSNLMSDTSKLAPIVALMKELQTELIAKKKAGEDIAPIQEKLRQFKEQQKALETPVAAQVELPKPNQQGFVHQSDVAIAKSPLKEGTAEQWVNELKRHGVGKEELEWSIGELPKGQLTKDQVLAHLDQNKVQLQEKWGFNLDNVKPDKIAKEKWQKDIERTEAEYQRLEPLNRQVGLDLENGKITADEFKNHPTKKAYAKIKAEVNWLNEQMITDTVNRTYGHHGFKPKYPSYQMPGGENYRELLLTLPEKQNPAVVRRNEINKRLEKIQDEHDSFDKLPDTPELFAKRKALYNENQKLTAEYNKLTSDYHNQNPNYTNSHFDDTPNVIAHVRMNDRFIPDPNGPKNYYVGRDNVQKGLKTLHAEELQSDWHQSGRKNGYKSNQAEVEKLNAEREQTYNDLEYARKYWQGRPDPDGKNGKVTGPSLLQAVKNAENYINTPEGKLHYNTLSAEEKASIDRMTTGWKKSYAERYPHGEPKSVKELETKLLSIDDKLNLHHNAVPNAPFKSNWDELALKRLITEAVNNGYDAVSWTPGRHQSTNPSTIFDKINVKKEGDEYHVNAMPKGKTSASDVVRQTVSEKELGNTVGKELTEKILKDTKSNNDWIDYRGLDLEIGGTKQFYDIDLVNKANKIMKKFGGKVEEEHLPVDEKAIRRKQSETKPDEQSIKDHSAEWDKLVAEKRALDRGFDEEWRTMDADVKTKLQNRLTDIEFAMDGLHTQMVEETMKRMIADRKNGEKIPIIKLTPEMKAKIKSEGFNLFSSPALIPVNHDPYQKKHKLVPIDWNPFTNKNVT